jgi:hypothetical protein
MFARSEPYELAPQPWDLHVDAALEDILVSANRRQQMLAKRTLRRAQVICNDNTACARASNVQAPVALRPYLCCAEVTAVFARKIDITRNISKAFPYS